MWERRAPARLLLMWERRAPARLLWLLAEEQRRGSGALQTARVGAATAERQSFAKSFYSIGRFNPCCLAQSRAIS